MKKILGGVVVALAATLVLAGCGNTNSKDTKSGDNKLQTVKLGVMPSTDNLPLLVAANEGLDKQNGVKIEIEPFKSAKDRDAAFQAGKVDGVISDVIALAIYEQGGMDVKVTSTTHDQFDLVADGGTSISDKNGKMVDRIGGVNSIKDLKGKSVIIAKNGGIEYATVKMLAAAGMKESDVKMLDVPPVPARLELLNSGKASAAVLPEPFITMGEADGQHVIDSTTKIGLNPFIIGFPAKTISAKKAAIQGFYKAYDQAVNQINNNRNDPKQVAKYRAMLVKNVGFPAKLTNKIKIDKFPKASQISAKDIDDAFSWAKSKGLLKKNLKAKDVLSDVYFK
ncbi:ABC transporter substrate-binding protein [Periweissella cryptocerci]|uniref:ABC transporter substrate-binding protein n=1 Tax=Periweissella cryptocerci TaxID=2506420 RepID=A0A4P6YRN3_9LACO|nr:ABC transporter substrate-binding protein [Periweissella cryptocerci]QBO35262.1 ABC transporter substrate-binding protein [Periweissella cryptocerci]